MSRRTDWAGRTIGLVLLLAIIIGIAWSASHPKTKSTTTTTTPGSASAHPPFVFSMPGNLTITCLWDSTQTQYDCYSR